jgi:hypothetical protein
VPTFVFDGRYAVSGAQPAATLVEVLAEVRRRGGAPDDGADDDVDDADACVGGACAAPAGRA